MYAGGREKETELNIGDKPHGSISNRKRGNLELRRGRVSHNMLPDMLPGRILRRYTFAVHFSQDAHHQSVHLSRRFLLGPVPNARHRDLLPEIRKGLAVIEPLSRRCALAHYLCALDRAEVGIWRIAVHAARRVTIRPNLDSKPSCRVPSAF
jgi:hypothetical protein